MRGRVPWLFAPDGGSGRAPVSGLSLASGSRELNIGSVSLLWVNKPRAASPQPIEKGCSPPGRGGQPRPPATYRQQATCPTDKTDPPRRSAEASTVSSAEPLTSRPCGHPSEGGEGLRKTERENPSHPQLKCKLRGLGYDEPSLAICWLDLRG